MQRGMLIGGLHLRPGDDAVAGGIAALGTSRHESIAVSGTVMTTQQPVATAKTPDNVQPRAKAKQAAVDDPEAMRQLQDKLTTTNALNVELRKKLGTATATSQTLEQQRKQLSNSLTAVKATKAALVDENKTLSKKLTAANALGTQLSQKLMTAKVAAKTLEQQHQKLTATVAAVNATNAALMNENKALSRRSATLQQQRAQEEKDDTSLNVQLENITTAYIALEKTNQAILNEKLLLTTNLNSLTQQLATQVNEKTELSQKKKELDVRIGDLQSLLERSKDSTAALTTQIDRLKERQREIIASEKALTAQKVLLEQALDQQRLSAELLETENVSLINRVQLLEKQKAVSVARANESGATKQPLTQSDSHSERPTTSAEAIDRFNHGLTLITQGRSDEAITVYEDLIKTFPQFPQPYNNLASVFASLGDLERAESLLRQGLELDDRYRLLRKNLGSLLIHRASRIYREAIDGERDTNASAKKEPIALQAFDMLSPLQ
jgi:myosin heavy subunit